MKVEERLCFLRQTKSVIAYIYNLWYNVYYMKFKHKENCRMCDRKLTYRNRLKFANLCRKCSSIYRAELNARKIKAQTNKFLEENPDVKMIDGFGDKYMVSNQGRVYRVTATGVKELKSNPDKYGYYTISLYYEGKRKTMKIHILVAKSWIPNPYPYVNKIINHKDGVKSNNHYTNLEWCTYRQNSVHAARTGLIPVGEDNKNHKLTEIQVKEICALRGVLTQQKLADLYGVSKKLIILIHKNKVWKHVKREKPRRRLLLNRKTKDGDLVNPLDSISEVVQRAIEEKLNSKKKKRRVKKKVNEDKGQTE